MTAEPEPPGRGRPDRDHPDPGPPGNALPAPYHSPWRRLAADLGDASADLRLRLQELLRRNREGSLPRPSWWPPALAPAFWPLILVAALGAVIALLLGLPSLTGRLQSRVQPTGSADSAVLVPGLGASLPARAGAAPSGGGSTPAPVPGATAAGPAGSAGPAPPAAPSGAGFPPAAGELLEPSPMDSAAASETATAGSPAAGVADAGAAAGADAAALDADAAAVAAAQARSRLRQALAAADPDGLIRDLSSDDPSASLSLELQDRFSSLTAAEQRRLAEAWQARAAALAYERLELRDRQGRLLGRPARVGAGMVLLQPAG